MGSKHIGSSFTLGLTITLLNTTPVVYAQQQLVPDWRRGSLSNPADDFGLVASAIQDVENRIWVLDNLRNELSIFSASGEFLFSLGSSGEGPGDFSSPIHMGSYRGGVWVSDAETGLLSFFALSGDFVRAVPARWRLNGNYQLAIPVGVTEGESLIYISKPRILHYGATGGRAPRMIVRKTASDEIEVLRRVPITNSVITFRGGQGVSAYQPFSDDPLIDIAGNGSWMVVVNRRVGEFGPAVPIGIEHIDLLTLNADTSEIILDAARLTDDLREDALAESVATIPPRLSDFAAAVREGLYLPEYIPPVDRVVATVDGDVWLRQRASTVSGESSEGSIWILVRGGSVVRRVSLPPTSDIRWASRHTLIVTEEDESGIEYVLQYTLR